MKSISKLSCITGYSESDLLRFLNLSYEDSNDIELSINHLKSLCKILGSGADTMGSPIILLSEDDLFRGIILRGSEVPMQTPFFPLSITVTYIDAKGERHIEALAKVDTVFQNKQVCGFTLKVENEKLFSTPQPMGDFFDTIYETQSVSVGKNKKGYFFVNKNNERISLYYEDITHDSCGGFLIKKESLYGLADEYGNVIVYPQYLEIGTFSEGYAPFKQLYLWGFLDTKGVVAVKPIYQSVEAFENGFAKVTMPVGRITNPQGFINTSGNAVIKDNHVTEYSDFCFAIPFGDYIIGIKHNQNAFDAFNSPKLYLLKNGSNHSSILLGGPNKSFFNDYFNKWMHIYDEDTKLYGLLSSDKKTIISCCFVSILKQSDMKVIGFVPSLKTSLTPILDTDNSGWALIKGRVAKDENKTISTRNCCGNWMFSKFRILKNSSNYDQCVEIQLNDQSNRKRKYLYAIAANGKYGIVDESNNAVLLPEFDDIILPSAHESFYDEYHEYDESEWLDINGKSRNYHIFYRLEDDINGRIFLKKDGKWHTYSYEGSRIGNNGYKDISDYAGVFILNDDNGYGIMVGDKIVVPCQYDSIKVKTHNNAFGRLDYHFFLLEKNKRKGLFIICVREVDLFYSIPVVYENIVVCDDRIIVQDKEYDLLRFSGESILGGTYDHITYIHEKDHYLVTLNGKQGVLDKEGNIVICIDYKQIAFTDGVYYLTDKNNLQGIFGILPCEYENIKGVNDCFIATKGKSRYFVSSDGKAITRFESCSQLDRVSICNKLPAYGKDTYRSHFATVPKEYQYKYPESGLYLITVDDAIGVINRHGEMIIPCDYQGAGIIAENVILAWTDKTMLLFTSDGKSQSDIYDRIETLPTYESRYDCPAFYVFQRGKIGLVLFKKISLFEETSFHIEYPCVFDELKIGSENRYLIDGISIRKKVLGPDGNYIEVPSEILWMSDFCVVGIAISVKGNRFGLVDCHFNVLRDYTFDNILKLDASHYLLSQNNETVLIRFEKNLKETILQSYSFHVVRRLASNLFCTRIDKKYGVCRYNPVIETMEVFLDNVFDEIIGHEDTFVIVNKSGLFGCYDNTGSQLLEEKYVSINPLYNKKSSFYNKYPSNYLKGNILVAKISNKEAQKHLYTIFSYKSRKSITINQVDISVHYFNEYETGRGCYIMYKDHNNKYGVISTDCDMDSGTFAELEPCCRHNGHPGFYVSENGLWGYLDYKTFNSIPCRFNQKVYFGEERQRFWVIENQKTKVKQFYDSRLKHVCTIPDMVDIKPFSTDKWMVSVSVGSSQLCGLYNDKMEVIIPPNYNSIVEGIKNQYIASVKEKYGYEMGASAIYDSDGNILSPLSDGAVSLHRSNSDYPGFYLKKGDSTRISYNGIDFTECEDNPDKEYISWGSLHYYSGSNDDGTKNIITGFGVEYFYVEENYTQDDITILKISGKYLVINRDKELSTETHEKITINPVAQYISLIDGDFRKFIDYDGVPQGEIKGKFSACILHKEAKVICGITFDAERKKQYRLYSDTGELLNDIFFNYIGTFSEGFATCVVNSEKTIDKDFFKRIRNFGYIDADHGQWGIINAKGQIVIPMKYDFIRPVKNGLTVYSKDYKFGVINPSKGKSTIAKYKYLDSFHDGLCRFRLFTDGDNPKGWYKSYEYSNYGFIDENGKEVIPPIFYDVTNFKSGIANIKSRDGYKNQIDKKGNLLHEWTPIPDSRDDYDDYDNGYTQSELDDMYRAAFEGDPNAQWNID